MLLVMMPSMLRGTELWLRRHVKQLIGADRCAMVVGYR